MRRNREKKEKKEKRKSMKTLSYLAVVLGFELFLGGTAAQAGVVLDVVPATQTVLCCAPFQVALQISGLGSGVALGVFDVNLSFDPTLLAFDGATFGDPILGDQLDLEGFGTFSFFTPGTGTVELFELSFDSPAALIALQAHAFTLATLTFNELDVIGVSPLGLSVYALGDANGNSLAAQLVNGQVTTTPEPAISLLVACGLAGLGGAMWRRNRLGMRTQG
jgi:hypothetical protein